MSSTIYSVGHSSHSWDDFRQLIEQPDIGCIVDVRSSPTSRWAHFRQHELRSRLNRIGISYLYLGDQLGGHPVSDPTDYEAMARTASFSVGIAKLLEIANRCRPAMMCAEADPLQCHRFLLIARHLVEAHSAEVLHILRDGKIEPHRHSEDRLLELHGGTEDLFEDRRARLDHAYVWQARRLGATR
ncbi:DUF488 domain-containing protein [Mesorhizobium sp. CN5-321]|uniref:DUF488 domain-containing protein n=1 Tax=Mesorhizobium hunchu TaxID=3157708 RepID=UPI0032B7479B